MLRLKLKKKNLLKAKFYGFETKKLTRLINLSFLLMFISFFCGFYFLDNLSKDDIVNKLKPSDQFLIKSGFKIENVLITGTQNLSNNYMESDFDAQRKLLNKKTKKSLMLIGINYGVVWSNKKITNGAMIDIIIDHLKKQRLKNSLQKKSIP